MDRGNIISIIDGAAGSCGKAKVIGEIVTDKSLKIRAAVTNCMPNAGHTFVNEKGRRYLFRNIPVSCINPDVDLFIGPGSAIDMDVFKQEYDTMRRFLRGRKIYVHDRVPLIEDDHKKHERESVTSGSTFKGCGAVTSDKVMRKPNLNFFETYENAVCCSNDEWLDRLHSHLFRSGEYVILEGAQGCDLSLNHSGNYPRVTSRNVSTAQMLADSGLPAEALLGTLMVIRPYPIRINNFTGDNQYIYTGDNGNGLELTWTDINLGALNGVIAFRGFGSREEFYKESFHAESILNRSMNIIITMYELLTKEYKYLILGNGEYKETLRADEIDFTTALEIERLYHKMQEHKTYVSVVIRKINNNGRVFDNPEYRITDLSEETSVTNRERRIFQIDFNKLRNNVKINRPYGIYLNFSEQLDINMLGLTGDYSKLKRNGNVNMNTIDGYIKLLEGSIAIDERTHPKVLALGTGAKNGERVLINNLIR